MNTKNGKFVLSVRALASFRRGLAKTKREECLSLTLSIGTNMTSISRSVGK
ncbi:MAG: hypothetical protein ABIS26_00380 [Candidatus Paceibacterota bacterium]